ncbi:BTAD domain-containing putative transcriptional regulator [Lentzea sp. NBRC 102530]|uniref:AfsR/SARP family transcriptional regulator n=1 Tax=Lentzea sp. NBRC 102530 TaxID=3032201 RepID=UPI0024A4E456|nr:BTAD domain-containing putative transcriptional regulator [Lentzea sp. NBRC 102530]GLY50828.1 SARP family transcriptional regulator [Lentzea sp. NBRC 102530]
MWPLVRCYGEETVASRPGLTFTVFGTVRAWRDRTEIDLGSPQQRLTLAVLLLAEGRVVQAPEIIDALWGESAPPTARGTIRTYVYRLRRLLNDDPGTAVLRSEGNGYQLVLAEEQLDLSRFLGLVRAAEASAAAHDRRRAVDFLHSSLKELRDEPLRGLRGEWADTERRRLGQLVVRTVELLSEHQLDLGDRVDVLEQLTAVSEAEPLRERVHELLIRALCREGRPAEALTVYDRLRATLRDELGVDPSHALRELHARVLRTDPALSSATSAPPERRAPSARSAPMPSALTVFAGREAELQDLNSVLDDVSAPRTVVVHGTAGVGKTTFVVQWASQVASSFPDGQFFVDLRGFGSGDAVREPADVLHELLDALDLPSAHRPSGLDGLITLYRSVLAERRALVVLDNARDTAQVMPLLSAAPGCVVVITSRRELTALVASTGAHSVRIGLLDMDESVTFMVHRLGEHRVRAELPALRTIAEMCAHLPLALAVAAARISSNPQLRLSDIADQLATDVEPGLDFLSTDDPRSDVRTVLSWSYRALSPEAARAFRLLALLPLSRTTTPTVASLTALSLPRTKAVLRELSSLCLVNEDGPGQFSWHDLLKEYAAEELAEAVGEEEQRAACHRLLGHYVVLTRSASLQVMATDDLPPLPQIPPGVTAQSVKDLLSAFDMFTSQRGTLLSLFDFATRWRLESLSWHLAWYLRHYLDAAFQWDEMTAINEIAAAWAGNAGDDLAIGYTHRSLARAAAMRGDVRSGLRHLQTAIEAFHASGDGQAEGYAHLQAANWLVHVGRAEAGLDHARQARALFRGTASRHQEEALREFTALSHAEAGRHGDVVDTLRRTLTTDYDSGATLKLLRKIEHLTNAYERLGEHHKAAQLHESALKLVLELTGADWARLPYSFEEQFATQSFLLARTLYLAGETDRALAVQREALRGLHSLFRKHHLPMAFQHPGAAGAQSAFAVLEDVLADERADHRWYAESLRAVDELASVMAGLGASHYLVDLRDRNAAIRGGAGREPRDGGTSR